MIWLLLIAPTVMVVSLWWRGRPWHRNAYSQGWIDGWSVTHVGHGIVFYAIVRAIMFNAPWLNVLTIVITLEAVWESIENRNWMIKLFRSEGDKKYWGDSIVNSLCDVAACALGAIGTAFFVG